MDENGKGLRAQFFVPRLWTRGEGCREERAEVVISPTE